MNPATRRNDPAASHRAEARIRAAMQTSATKIQPSEAVEKCCETLREFSERDIRSQMQRDYPGANVDTGSICSFERMRGVLSDLKKAGFVVPLPLEEGSRHQRFRYVDLNAVPKLKQTDLFQ
jgi:hypothetical protein